MTGFVYRNAPKSILHSWVEINFENQWYELEAVSYTHLDVYKRQVSTFNTDYILVKDADFEKSLAVLLNAGYTVI